MTDQSSTIVQRLWKTCNVLRDNGMSYGDPLATSWCKLASPKSASEIFYAHPTSVFGFAPTGCYARGGARLHPEGMAGRWGSALECRL